MIIRRVRVAPAFLAWELTNARRLRQAWRDCGVTRLTVPREGAWRRGDENTVAQAGDSERTCEGSALPW